MKTVCCKPLTVWSDPRPRSPYLGLGDCDCETCEGICIVPDPKDDTDWIDCPDCECVGD